MEETTNPTVDNKKPGFSKALKIVLLAAGAIIVIVGALMAVGFFATRSTAKDATEFVNAVIAKDYVTAYGFFSKHLKAEQSQDSLEAAFAGAPFTDACIFKIA